MRSVSSVLLCLTKLSCHSSLTWGRSSAVFFYFLQPLYQSRLGRLKFNKEQCLKKKTPNNRANRARGWAAFIQEYQRIWSRLVTSRQMCRTWSRCAAQWGWPAGEGSWALLPSSGDPDKDTLLFPASCAHLWPCKSLGKLEWICKKQKSSSTPSKAVVLLAVWTLSQSWWQHCAPADESPWARWKGSPKIWR